MVRAADGMLEILWRILTIDWRRHGAATREASIARSRVWYAEFAPLPSAEGAAAPPRGRSPGRNRRDRVPTLVLVHGLGATSAAFYPLIPRLRRGYRVVVADLPGYGWSRPPRGREWLTFPELVGTAERFVQKVAPRGAYLVGNSMGGWIATKIAARRPDLVLGLGLLNPGGPALRAEDWVEFARIVYGDDRTMMSEYFSRLFHSPPLALRLFARDFQRILRGPAVTSLVASLGEADFLAREEAQRVRCPSVLVWGESDRLIPAACRDFYLANVPGIRYEPIASCGHCPQLERPARTAEILLALAGVSSPAAVSARSGWRAPANGAERERGVTARPQDAPAAA